MGALTGLSGLSGLSGVFSGGGAAVSPSDIPGLDLWMDASQGYVGSAGSRLFVAADTEHFEIADNADLSTGDIDWSIACWFLAKSPAATSQPIISKDNTVGTGREYNLFLTSSSLAFYTFDAAGSFDLATEPVAIVADKWYFCVAWNDSVANTVNIQIDNGTVNTVSHTMTPQDGPSPFKIGADSITRFFDGNVARAGFWKKVLTAAEKTALYNEGNGLLRAELDTTQNTSLISYWNLNEALGSDAAVDSAGSNDLTVVGGSIEPDIGPRQATAADTSGNDNHGTLTNMDTVNAWVADVPANTTADTYALGFDGVDDHVKTPLLADGTWTWSYWIKVDAFGLFNPRMIRQGTFDRHNVQYNDTGKITAQVKNTTGTAFAINTAAGILTTDTWTHIVWRMSLVDETQQLFVNNVQRATGVAPTALQAGGGDWELGGGPQYIDGIMSDARVYNTAITNSNIEYLYTNGASGTDPTTTNLQGQWLLDDGPQNVSAISDGDPVVSWISREGNNRLFNQATASKRPAYVANAANGFPGVDFDGTDDLLEALSAFLTGTTGTVILGVVPDAVTADGVVISSSDEGTTTDLMEIFGPLGATGDELSIQHDANRVDGDTVVTAAAHVLTVSSSGTAYSLRVDGNDETESVGAGSNTGDWWGDLAGADNVVLGALKHTSETNFFNGKILIGLAYDSELAGTDLTNAETYVADLLGVTLA